MLKLKGRDGTYKGEQGKFPECHVMTRSLESFRSLTARLALVGPAITSYLCTGNVKTYTSVGSESRNRYLSHSPAGRRMRVLLGWVASKACVDSLAKSTHALFAGNGFNPVLWGQNLTAHPAVAALLSYPPEKRGIWRVGGKPFFGLCIRKTAGCGHGRCLKNKNPFR